MLVETMIGNIPPALVCSKKVFDFTERSYIMGILNVTPDSFSDGGMYVNPERAISHGMHLSEQGVDIIDVGGESTRPGAVAVSVEEEIKRVIPVIKVLTSKVDVPISIDTTKAEVARRALDAGAEIVNDVSALRFDPKMGAVIADYKVPVVLMHMRGTPTTMQHEINYTDLIDDIISFLQDRINTAVSMGIAPEKIIIDPGIGFGKSVIHDNVTILRKLDAFQQLGKPILVGTSRKAFIGKILDKDVHDREQGTAATVAIAVYNGANFVRVHNVKSMKLVVAMADAIRRNN